MPGTAQVPGKQFPMNKTRNPKHSLTLPFSHKGLFFCSNLPCTQECSGCGKSETKSRKRFLPNKSLKIPSERRSCAHMLREEAHRGYQPWPHTRMTCKFKTHSIFLRNQGDCGLLSSNWKLESIDNSLKIMKESYFFFQAKIQYPAKLSSKTEKWGGNV